MIAPVTVTASVVLVPRFLPFDSGCANASGASSPQQARMVIVFFILDLLLMVSKCVQNEISAKVMGKPQNFTPAFGVTRGNAMLLNEFLKEHSEVEQQRRDFEAALSQQQEQIEALTSVVQK